MCSYFGFTSYIGMSYGQTFLVILSNCLEIRCVAIRAVSFRDQILRERVGVLRRFPSVDPDLCFFLPVKLIQVCFTGSQATNALEQACARMVSRVAHPLSNPFPLRFSASCAEQKNMIRLGLWATVVE